MIFLLFNEAEFSFRKFFFICLPSICDIFAGTRDDATRTVALFIAISKQHLDNQLLMLLKSNVKALTKSYPITNWITNSTFSMNFYEL